MTEHVPHEDIDEQMAVALKLAYRKHHMGDQRVSWTELSDAMCDALAEYMGDDAFVEWAEAASAEMDAAHAGGGTEG